MNTDDYMIASEAAELAGINLSTFTSYVNRGYAPKPAATIWGRRVFERAAIIEWAKTRPRETAGGD